MNTAVFAGSFDPFTFAHKDLVDRGLKLFDRIIIAIGVNGSKKGLMPFAAREKAISELYAQEENVEVRRFSGLTVGFCRSVGAKYLLRGLRNTRDFEFEQAIAQNNRLLAPEVETFFLIAAPDLAHISSTIVRDILVNGGDVSRLVPFQWTIDSGNPDFF